MKFVENKGQWDAKVKFRAQMPFGVLFAEQDRLTFQIWNPSEWQRFWHNHGQHAAVELPLDTLQMHVYQVVFKNGQTTEPVGELPLTEYHNYFIGKDRSRWASGVKQYQQIRYADIYPGIDLLLAGSAQGPKYEFHVRQDADVSHIQMEYLYTDGLGLSGDSLKLATAPGILSDLPPVSWTASGAPLRFTYRLEDHTVGFQGVQPSEDFVIDPILIFGTFSGSTSDNWGFTATYDRNGRGYAGGIVMGTGYPTTQGAFQVTFNGGTSSLPTDVAITKYTSDGTSRMFSTFLGGSANELPHSMVVNEEGQLLVMGVTGSSDWPTTVGAFDSTYNGGSNVSPPININFTTGTDIFVVRFNETGSQLLASTYVGGTGNDGLNSSGVLNYWYGDQSRGEILVDADGRCYVGSNTSSNNFPTQGAFQGTLGGGQDGVLFSMDSSLSTMISSSYYGGSGDDAVFGIALNSIGELYACGGTNSGNLTTTNGAYQTTAQGGVDGFLVRLDSFGTTLMNATYIGTVQHDEAYLVQTDAFDYPYITGQTEGNFPVTNGVYSNTGGGQFIQKLNPSLSTNVASTRYGTGGNSPDIVPSAFLVDDCQQVYVSGWGGLQGGGTSGLPLTNGAFQSTTDNRDFYLIVFGPNMASLAYATFFGGSGPSEHVDGGTSRFDPSGIVYQSVCAGCGGSSQFPTTSTAASTTNNSANCNNGLFKFDLEITPIQAGVAIDSSTLGVCEPQHVRLRNRSKGGNIYYWDFGDNSTAQVSDTTSQIHTYAAGTYTVQLIAVDTTRCVGRDTATVTFTVYPVPQLSLSATNTKCNAPTGTATASVTGGSGSFVYRWNGAAPTTQNMLTQQAAGSVQAIVRDSAGCLDTATVIIPSQPRPQVAIDSIFHVQCHGDKTGRLTTQVAGGSGNIQYSWSTNPVQTTYHATQLGAGGYTVIVTDSNGCKDTAAAVITQPTKLSLNLTPTNARCFQSNDASIAGAINGGTPGYTFVWQTNPPKLSATIDSLSPGTYALIVYDSFGCGIQRTATVTQPAPLVLNRTSSDVRCYGQNNGWASAGASGGTPNYSYLWSTGQTQSVINNLQPGFYTIHLEDANGCSQADTFEIREPLPIVAPATISHVTCHGDSDGQVLVNPSGGTGNIFLQWSSGSTQNPLVGIPAQTYVATLIDAHGCDSIFSYTVNEPPPLQIQLQSTVIACHGDSSGTAQAIPAGGNGGYQITWLTQPPQQGPQANQLPAGYYAILLEDQSGCQLDTHITIAQNAPIVINLNPSDISCFGDANGLITTLAQGGVGPYSYHWQPGGQNTATINNLGPGAYALSVTDALGCVNADSSTITEPDPLHLTYAAMDITCYGSSDGAIHLQAQGGTGSLTVAWIDFPGSPGLSKTGLPADTFEVQLTDLNGCTLNDTIRLVQPLPITVQSQIIDNVCADDTLGRIDLTIGGGKPGYEVLWSDGDHGTQRQGLTAGIFLYTVTDSAGCTLIRSDTVTSPPPLVLTINATPITCPGDNNASLTATGTGGTPPLTYQWSTGAMGTSISSLAPGSYAVSITDAYGCMLDTTREIAEPNDFSIDAGPDKTITITQSAVLEGQVAPFGSYAYSWSPPSSLNALNVLQPLASPTRSTTYTITAWSLPDSCMHQDTVRIEVLPFPAIFAPTAFTPNGDGQNDYFTVYPTRGEVTRLLVFNRWGQVVHDSPDPWYGDLNGKPQPLETYVFIAYCTTEHGAAFPPRQGNVTLIR